jgi:hypothetical protein
MRQLRNEITCLHCWNRFPPEDVLWSSEHRELAGDPLLGSDAQLRFLPNRFDVNGNAIDLKGQVCRELACPRCHLPVPRALLERQPLFVSILGTPACGKSYLLGALATTLRRELPTKFRLGLHDADTVSNQLLVRYEEQLFLSQSPDEEVALGDLIPKTQLHGDLYYSVGSGEHRITYPRPFSFLLEPLEAHPNFAAKDKIQRVLCLYDNAGEHYLPGQDSTSAPGTRHLAESNFLVFVFDPTQDPRWHAAARRANVQVDVPRTQHAGRQEAVLREAASRICKLRGLPDGARHQRPLIVVLSKEDTWREMLPAHDWSLPLTSPNGGIRGVDMARIEEQSRLIRGLLECHIPELIYAAEACFQEVYYLKASALGNRPEYRDGKAFVHPRDIVPSGVSVPILLGLALTTKGIVRKDVASSTASANA